MSVCLIMNLNLFVLLSIIKKMPIVPLRPQRGIRHGIFPHQTSQSSVTYTYVMNTNRHMDKVLWQHKRKETGSASGGHARQLRGRTFTVRVGGVLGKGLPGRQMDHLDNGRSVPCTQGMVSGVWDIRLGPEKKLKG